LLAFTALAFAQSSLFPLARGRSEEAEATRPSEAILRGSPDRTVTFQVQAPDATVAKLSGDFVQSAQEMKKGDDGYWSITSGRSIRQSNSLHLRRERRPQHRIRGIQWCSWVIVPPKSLFEVPADQPAPYDLQPVASRKPHVNWVQSNAGGAAQHFMSTRPRDTRKANRLTPVLY